LSIIGELNRLTDKTWIQLGLLVPISHDVEKRLNFKILAAESTPKVSRHDRFALGMTTTVQNRFFTSTRVKAKVN